MKIGTTSMVFWHWDLYECLKLVLEAAKRKDIVVTVENMEWEKEDELVRTAQEIRRFQNMLTGYYHPALSPEDF